MDVPALATAVIRSGSIDVHVEGDADAGSHFHLGSNAKAMTATLAAIAVEHGLLDWAEVVPLLSHTAGIRPLTEDDEIAAYPPDRPSLAAVLLAEPSHPPGTYSNGGYAIAAWLLEEATGATWEQLLQDWLAQPLGVDLRVGWPADIDGRYEDGRVHDREDGYVLPAAIAPAGDVNATPADYARFVQLHLRGLRGDAELLTHETFLKLHTPVHETIALGWGVQPWEGATTSVHVGSAGTFVAVVALQPARDLAVVALTNAGGAAAQSAAIDAARALVRQAA